MSTGLLALIIINISAIFIIAFSLRTQVKKQELTAQTGSDSDKD